MQTAGSIDRPQSVKVTGEIESLLGEQDMLIDSAHGFLASLETRLDSILSHNPQGEETCAEERRIDSPVGQRLYNHNDSILRLTARIRSLLERIRL